MWWWLWRLEDIFITAPLWKLFRYGPVVSRYVPMYGNMTNEAMCARLSGVAESTWQQIPHECEDLIQREFNSWQVLFTVCAYVYIVVRIINTLPTLLTPRPRYCYFVDQQHFIEGRPLMVESAGK